MLCVELCVDVFLPLVVPCLCLVSTIRYCHGGGIHSGGGLVVLVLGLLMVIEIDKWNKVTKLPRD